MEENIDPSSEATNYEKEACVMDLNSLSEDSFHDEGEQPAASSPMTDGKHNSKEINKIIVSNSVRSTRSKDNPEFVAKQRSFIAKITGSSLSSGNNDHLYAINRPDTPGKRKRESSNANQPSLKRKKSSKSDSVNQEWQNDSCCWECHREGVFICCEMCPRVFHIKCAGLEKEPEEDWACSECHSVMLAENVENRTRAMQLISVDQLCILLKYALNRLKSMPAMEPFCNPVDEVKFPTYCDMVIHPVDFTTLETNIKRKFYGSTEAFLSDARWIVHNSVIFNGANSKVTSLARTLIRILKQELSEIETCPDCYENAHCKPESWFTEACRLAHPLVWAKLKGFPYWPAKAVKWKDTNVDVRFFGRHDRSWVPLKECFLFSEQMPTPLKSKNKTLETCLVEVEEHIEKLRIKFGKFNYAAHRTQFDPYDLDQIRVLLPLYKGPAILRIRSQARSISRQSGHSGTDDETSSITSTDSGTSFSRIQKKAIRERLMINTPETDDYDSFNNEEENQIGDSSEKRSDFDENEDIDNLDKYPGQTTEIIDKDNLTENELALDKGSGFNQSTLSEDISNEPENESASPETSLHNDQSIEGEPSSSTDPSACTEEILCTQKDMSLIEEASSDLISEDNASLTVPDVNCKFSSNLENLPISSVESKDSTLLNLDSNLELTSEAKLKFLKSIKPRPLSHKLKLLNLNRTENKHLENGEHDGVSNFKKSLTDGDEPNDNDSKINKPVTDVDQNKVSNLSIIDDLERINMLLRNEVIENSNDSSNEGKDVNDSEPQSSTALSNTMINMNKLSSILKMNADIGANRNESVSNKNTERKSSDDKSDFAYEKVNNSHSEENETELENKSDMDEDQLSDDDRMHIDEGSFENGSPNSKDANNDGKIQEILEEDYFQGFLNEINLTKKVESIKDSFNNNQMAVEKGKDLRAQDSESASEADEKESPENCETPDDEADRFNEQLRSNSSLTIGKVSLPKSIKLQKVNSDDSEIKNISKLKGFLPSINVTSISKEKIGNTNFADEKESNSNDEEMLVKKHQTKSSSESAAVDFKNYASKLFHNITISSKSMESADMKEKTTVEKEKRTPERKSNFSSFVSKRRSSKDDKISDDDSSRMEMSANESLLEAVRLVQNIGNIAIKRVDNKTLEHTSGNDSVTISVANDLIDNKSENSDSSSNKSKTVSKKEVKVENNDPLASIRGNGCVSFSKASDQEKEKIKMPSGVDTTRLSPSISITPVSSSASPTDKSPKIKSNPSPSISGSQQNFTRISSSSPVVVNAGSTTPNLTSASPSLQPPHMLAHALPSPTNSMRSIFSPHMPGLSMPGGNRTPITSPAPGLRMMTNAPLMMAGRLPGPQMQIVRHLPPDAGPLSCELHKHSHKLAEMMRNSLEDVLAGLVGIGTPEARLAALQLELERSNWRHQQELVEVRHNADVMLVEIRANLEAEKIRAVEEVRRQMEQKVAELRRQTEIQFNDKVSEIKRQADAEKQRAIEETKKKQWCANCGKEALFFCCWNTSYCDYPCQQSHWPQHMTVCGQNSDSSGGSTTTDGASETVNGDGSCHSSRGPTPVQNLRNNTQIKNLMEEDDSILSDDRRRRKRKEDQSPIYSDGMGRSISPACSGNNLVNVPMPMGGASPLGQQLSALGAGMRSNMGAPSMAAIAAMAGAQNPVMGMKMTPRFMQHSMMQQQPMFAGMDPRMLMMMRNLGGPGPSLMMRGHPNPMQTFRPRFM